MEGVGRQYLKGLRKASHIIGEKKRPDSEENSNLLETLIEPSVREKRENVRGGPLSPR